jgi:hypothetical protein
LLAGREGSRHIWTKLRKMKEPEGRNLILAAGRWGKIGKEEI